MRFCDFRPLFGKPSMSWLRCKHEVQGCWSHNAVHMSSQSNQSVELTNTSTGRPVYAPNTSRQLSTQCTKCSPSNFKIRTFITLLSALSGWCFVCFFKGNMKASELKNQNQTKNQSKQPLPPKQILYSFIIYWFLSQNKKYILRLLETRAAEITCPRWF